jgi:hypothetical protein
MSTTRIASGYRCFDRILLNGLIQPFQQPERVGGFFNSYRQFYPVSRDVLRGAAEQFQTWVKEEADGMGHPRLEAPKGRRDEFVEPHFKGARRIRLLSSSRPESRLPRFTINRPADTRRSCSRRSRYRQVHG